MSETVSVVIPTHGRRRLVLQALDSVRQQTRPVDEVIVVVDRDVDGTAEAVLEFWPTVVVVMLDGQGAAAARNAGIARATGSWVAFLDDDDLWHRSLISRTLEYLAQNPGCAAVRTWTWLFSTTEESPSSIGGLSRDFLAEDLEQCHHQANSAESFNDFGYLMINGRSLDLLLERNRGIIITSMVRRAILESCPPVPADLRVGEDWYLHVAVATHTEWCTIPERLAFLRIHSGESTFNGALGGATVAVMGRLWRDFGHLAPRPLETYGPMYARVIQRLSWITVQQRDMAGLRELWRSAPTVLPRRRDRVAAFVPEPVAYRVRSARRR